MPSEYPHVEVAHKILEKSRFKTVNGEIYVYHPTGVYLPNGKAYLEKRAQHIFAEKASTYHVNEVVNWIKRENYIEPYEFDKRLEILNCRSGFINMDTLELKEHDPEYLSMIQIPVYYHPEGDAPAIVQFFNEVLKPEDIDCVLELFAYCLIRDMAFQKAFLLVGEGANGKSTMIELLRVFRGKENCSSVSLHELEENKFRKAELAGKMVNLSSDIPSKGIRNVEVFKELTGGDTLTAERKFGHPFQFKNHAKLVFSANRPPKILNDDTLALWRRFIIIDFPNKFLNDSADKNLLAKLTTPEELSGLLNLVLKARLRLIANQGFSYHKTIEEVSQHYTILSDPITSFIDKCYEIDSNATVEKQEVYDAYYQYCQNKGISPVTKETFGRNLTKSTQVNIGSIRLSKDGQRAYAWKGLKLKDI